MKICTTQIKPLKGNIEGNIESHKIFIELAASGGADLIFFPELSLTGYEPKLADKLAVKYDDECLNELQIISDKRNITISAGLPTRGEKGILISMVIFQPREVRQLYSKQYLHSDELPYFTEGEKQVILKIGGENIAPAIYYESLLPEHSEDAVKCGAGIYIASVAKPSGGLQKAFKRYPEIAKKYSMPIVMSNSVEQCSDFICAGRSSVWNGKGELLGQLDETNEGILIFDTGTEEITIRQI